MTRSCGTPRCKPFRCNAVLDAVGNGLIRIGSYIARGMKMPNAPSTDNAVSEGPALNKIEWVVRTLGVTIGDHAAPKSGAAAGASIAALQKSRLVWESTRKSIQTQLKELEGAVLNAVRKHNEDESTEDEYEEGEVTQSIPTLHTLLEKYDTRLIDKLDEALNAGPDQRPALQQQAAGIIKEYQTILAGDTNLALVDSSGLLPAAIKPIVEKTLSV